ncbi:MAG: response regulator transcription factor [Rhodospirillaceae bacterium]
MSVPRLLVVDDDLEMRDMLTRFLQRHGFCVLAASTQAEIEAHLDDNRIDLILLDVMLGDENGITICRELRQSQDVPIILVSALSADHQRMAGYEVGADDYISKPFNPDLLLARVRAVLRRGLRVASLTYRRNTNLYRFAGWTYDGKKDAVTAPGGFQVSLSKRETSLLKVLLSNPRIPLTRQEIAETLDRDRPDPPTEGRQDLKPEESRAIDVLVGRLRSKLEPNPKDPTLLRTERGIGYVLAADVVSEDL